MHICCGLRMVQILKHMHDRNCNRPIQQRRQLLSGPVGILLDQLRSAYPNADSYPNANSDPYTNPGYNSYSYAHPSCDTHSNASHHPNPRAHSYPNPDASAHGNPRAHGDASPDPGSNKASLLHGLHPAAARRNRCGLD